MDGLISRQAALNALKEEYNRRRSNDGLRLAWIEKAINTVPTAHPLDPCETCVYKGKGWDEEPCDGCTGMESKYKPDSGWIPVSERLPEGGRNVIFCDSKWNVCEGVYHAIPGQWVGFRWNAIYHHDDVTAWMPLPKPYKEEE